MSARSVVAAVVAAAGITAGITVPLASATDHAPATPRAAAGPVTVAVVSSASGGHLSVRHTNGSTSALAKGDDLRLGDTVLAGPGATAKITVTVPAGHSSDEQLIYVKPTGGAHHAVTMRGDAHTMTVTIG